MLRILIFWLSMLAIVLGTFIAGQAVVDPPGLSKLIGFGLAALGLPLAWITFPETTRQRTILVILIVGLICRLAIFEMPPSTDINRYIWEGKITAQGINPYQSPASVAADELRDHWWQGMNHRDSFTAYPPIAMLIFAGLASINESADFFKGIFIVADLFTLAVLFLLLTRAEKPIKHALLYGLNPLVLFAFAGEAHYDSIFVLFTVMSVYFFDSKRFALMWICVALAINIKIIPLILVPWLLLNSPKKYLWVFAITLIVPAIPFLQHLPNLFTGIREFGHETSFNSPIHSVLRLSTGSIELASWICYAILAVTIGFACHRFRDSKTAASAIFTAFIMCSPIVHYWYLIWAIPFVLLSLRLAWFWLWITSGLYFLTSYSVDTGGAWELPVWAIIFQWLPFTVLLLFLKDHKFSALRKHYSKDAPLAN